jgi:ADP-ribose pyrophosphatase YjhB (NUDIX family)
VELGETLEEAVIREVKEETSLDVFVERFLLGVESIGSRNTNEIGGRRIPWNEVRFFFLCAPAIRDAAASQTCLPRRESDRRVLGSLARLA